MPSHKLLGRCATSHFLDNEDAQAVSNQLFVSLDRNENGLLEQRELDHARKVMLSVTLGSSGVLNEAVPRLMVDMDLNADGIVDDLEWQLFTTALYEVLGQRQFLRIMRAWSYHVKPVASKGSYQLSDAGTCDAGELGNKTKAGAVASEVRPTSSRGHGTKHAEDFVAPSSATGARSTLSATGAALVSRPKTQHQLPRQPAAGSSSRPSSGAAGVSVVNLADANDLGDLMSDMRAPYKPAPLGGTNSSWRTPPRSPACESSRADHGFVNLAATSDLPDVLKVHDPSKTSPVQPVRRKSSGGGFVRSRDTSLDAGVKSEPVQAPRPTQRRRDRQRSPDQSREVGAKTEDCNMLRAPAGWRRLAGTSGDPLTCPGRHGLTLTRGFYACDLCHRHTGSFRADVDYKGSEVYRCQICDYDVCADCLAHAPAGYQHAPASPAEPARPNQSALAANECIDAKPAVTEDHISQQSTAISAETMSAASEVTGATVISSPPVASGTSHFAASQALCNFLRTLAASRRASKLDSAPGAAGESECREGVQGQASSAPVEASSDVVRKTDEPCLKTGSQKSLKAEPISTSQLARSPERNSRSPGTGSEPLSGGSLRDIRRGSREGSRRGPRDLSRRGSREDSRRGSRENGVKSEPVQTFTMSREEKAELEEAAVKIQSSYRGYGARRQVETAKSEKQAVVKIQSVHRGRKGRRESAKLKSAKQKKREQPFVTMVEVFETMASHSGMITSLDADDIIDHFTVCKQTGLNIQLARLLPQSYGDDVEAEDLSPGEVMRLCEMLTAEPGLELEREKEYGHYVRRQLNLIKEECRSPGYIRKRCTSSGITLGLFGRLLKVLSWLMRIDEEYIMLHWIWCISGIFEMSDALVALLYEDCASKVVKNRVRRDSKKDAKSKTAAADADAAAVADAAWAITVAEIASEASPTAANCDKLLKSWIAGCEEPATEDAESDAGSLSSDESDHAPNLLLLKEKFGMGDFSRLCHKGGIVDPSKRTGLPFTSLSHIFCTVCLRIEDHLENRCQRRLARLQRLPLAEKEASSLSHRRDLKGRTEFSILMQAVFAELPKLADRRSPLQMVVMMLENAHKH